MEVADVTRSNTKTILHVIICLSILGLLVFVCLCVVLRASLQNARATEAVHSIALAISRAIAENPAMTEHEFDKEILNLQRASVIYESVDESGKPLDPYGAAYVVVVDHVHGGRLITVKSKGPDGQLGTEDDISYRQSLRNSDTERGEK